MLTIICVKRSGGVIIAAKIRTAMKECFLYFFNHFEVIIPSLENIKMTTGKRKRSPVKKTVETIVLR